MSRIEIGGVHVEYHEQGTGEPVLLLHSSGGSNAQWRALVERLSDRFRVIAPDLYGYGASAHWPGRGPFSLAQEAEIAHALLGRLGEPAHLVGHSYGGAVALHVARLRSDLLRSLTVIEPVAFHLLSDRSEIIEVAESVMRALACGDYAGGLRCFVDYWSGPGAWDAVPAAKRDAMAPRLAKIALDFHATLNEPARLEDFRNLPLPTLVLHGACSPSPTRSICELLAAVLPDSQITAIEGAGHMAPLTHREAINALIAAHLDMNSGQLSRRPMLADAFSGTGVSCAAGSAA
jgi:pimeloyl-ACP methyl ester carboxylesterase